MDLILRFTVYDVLSILKIKVPVHIIKRTAFVMKISVQSPSINLFIHGTMTSVKWHYISSWTRETSANSMELNVWLYCPLQTLSYNENHSFVWRKPSLWNSVCILSLIGYFAWVGQRLLSDDWVPLLESFYF